MKNNTVRYGQIVQNDLLKERVWMSKGDYIFECEVNEAVQLAGDEVVLSEAEE